MKEYKLLAWPELSAEYRRTGHRRVLSEMSLRYMSLVQLTEVSGLKKNDVRAFVDMLDGRGLVADRDGTAPDSIRPFSWLRRAKAVTQDGR